MGTEKDEINIEEYSGLVKAIAAKYSHLGLPFEDLLQEGMIGLLEAKERYDDNRGVAFSTYATFWVKKMILESVSKEAQETTGTVTYNDALDNDEESELLADNSSDGESVDDEDAAALIPDDFPQEEKTVLDLHFNGKKTLNEIATEMNISRERVRQLKQKGLRRMRAKL